MWTKNTLDTSETPQVDLLRTDTRPNVSKCKNESKSIVKSKLPKRRQGKKNPKLNTEDTMTEKPRMSADPSIGIQQDWKQLWCEEGLVHMTTDKYADLGGRGWFA